MPRMGVYMLHVVIYPWFQTSICSCVSILTQKATKTALLHSAIGACLNVLSNFCEVAAMIGEHPQGKRRHDVHGGALSGVKTPAMLVG